MMNHIEWTLLAIIGIAVILAVLIRHVEPKIDAYTAPLTWNGRFLVVPGPVVSQTDGDEHYIDASQVIRLYGVEPAKCTIYDDRFPGLRSKRDRYIILDPQVDGNYNLVAAVQRSGLIIAGVADV